MTKIGLKLVVLSTIYLIILIVQACESRIDCGEIRDHLNAIDGSPQRIISIHNAEDTTLATISVQALESNSTGIRYDSLAIKIDHDLIVAYNIIKTNFDLGINNSYACSPVFDYDYINEVILTSNQDYNSSYPSGTNIIDNLNVQEGYFHDFGAYGEEVLDFINLNPVSHYPFYFTFIFPPDEDKIHDLTVKYVLEDGRELETTIANVLLKK